MLLNDRRKFIRYPCNLQVFVDGPDQPGVGQCRNISVEGVGLLLDRSVPSGTLLTLRLPGSPAGLPPAVRVEVAHEAKRDDGRLVGGKLVPQLQGDELLAAHFLPDRPAVLLVEEETGVREVATLVLREAGICVWPVASGLEAVTVYRRYHSRFGIVLLDLGMSGMDGVQTLAQLQAINQSVECWFMTGGSSRYTPAELRQLGASCVIAKPFNLSHLVEALRLVLTTREPGRSGPC